MQRQKQNLKFKIIQISSEDPDYPASELLNPSPKSRGWQSQRNPTFPQFITIQFQNPVLIHSLAYLSHHYKIASSVALQINFEKGETNLAELNFRKIGKFILSNNEHNDFRSRELKTVFVDAPAIYVRLSLARPFQNSLNIFNQIGVVGIQFFGEVIEQAQIQRNSILPDQTIQNDVNFLMDDLMVLKSSFLKQQDYQQAQQIQLQQDQLVQIQQQITALEQQKNIAVQNNDFDQAISLVEQIKKIKMFQEIQNQQIREQLKKSVIQKSNFIKDSQIHQIPQDTQIQNDSQNISVKRTDRVKRHYRNRPQKKQIEQNQDSQESHQSQEIEQNLQREEYIDDRPLPTQQKKNTFDVKEFPSDEDQITQEPSHDIQLTKQQKIEAQQFSNIFEDYFLKQAFSSQWSHKQEACQQILVYLQNSKNLQNLPNSFIVVQDLNYTIFEIWNLALKFVKNSVPKINQNGLEIILLITELIISNKINLQKYKDQILQGCQSDLIKQTNDLKNDSEVNQLRQIYLNLLNSGILNQDDFITQITTIKKGKKPLNFKALISRCNFLKIILNDFDLEDFQINKVLDFCQNCLQNSNKQVRNSSLDLISLLSVQYSRERILQFFESSNLRKPLYDSLLEHLPENNNFEEEQKIQNIVEQEYEENYQQTLNEENEQDVDDQYEEEIDEEHELCNFCLRIDKNQLTNEQYDMHLWKECPMLTFCDLCQQVVEVSEFNNHLLTECKESEFYSKCPRCQNSILNDEFEEHIENQQCKVLRMNQGYERCPLCGLDLLINQDDPDMTWREHLVKIGCVKNPRTNQFLKLNQSKIFQ